MVTNIGDKAAGALIGGFSVLNGYFGIANIVKYMNNKSAVLNKLISSEPEITKEIYQIAEKTAEEIV